MHAPENNKAAQSTIASDFIVSMFGPVSEHPIYICSLPNLKDDPAQAGERHVLTRIPKNIDLFAARHDQPGRACYFCVSTVRAKTKRKKDNTVECVGLHADLDIKDIDGDTSRDYIVRRLNELKYPPSIVIFSGHGYHCYWLFKESIDIQSNIDRIENALKQLADLLAGDLVVCEVAHLMRLPGTHNSKDGTSIEVEIIRCDPSLRYELDDLEEWLSETSSIFLRKNRERTVTVGETNFFTEFAKQHSFAPPIDVEARLKAMMYMAGGDASVHGTQISVSASMLNSGLPIDEIVSVLLEATKAAAGTYGARWNWKREERTIRDLCESWLKKHPELRQEQELLQQMQPTPKPVAAPRDDERQSERANADGKVAEPVKPKPRAIVATPYVWKDPATIPPREWLYGRQFIRKFVSATVAPGGIGKSSLEIAEVLAMVSGKALLGVSPDELLRVWFYNLEDPRAESERRIQAAAIQFNLDPADIGDRLYLDCGRDQPLVIAMTVRNNTVINRPAIDAIVAEITTRKIDVLIIDPFVSCHQVQENDNSAYDMIVKEWGRVADLGNCAIELVHHARKSLGGDEITVESSRGGKSLTDGCRMVRTINPMTKDEANKAGVENHRLYFRTFGSKLNLAPPPDKSDWFKLVSVDLGNGPANMAGTGGDSVGVAVKWKWPDHLDGVTGRDFDEVAAVIRSGHWRESSQAANWVGHAVARAMTLDVNSKADKAKITELLKTWLRSGALVVVPGQTEDRKSVKFVEVRKEPDDD